MNNQLIFYFEKRLLFVFSSLFISLFFGKLSAQNSYIQHLENGWARSVISVSNSDTAVWVGQTTINHEMRIVKTYRDSLVDWSKSIGGGTSSFDRANDVVETADGYVMVGNTASFGAGGTDIIVTKVNFSGVHQWTRTIGTSRTDYGNAIIKTSDGNIAICGKIASSLVDIAYFAKLNNNDGSFISEKQLRNGSGASEFFDLIQTDDGGFLYVGKTNNDFFMVKMASNLAVTFGKKWGGGNYDILTGVVENVANDYTVFGGTYSFGAGLSDGYAMRFTANGSTLTNTWTNTYGSSGGEDFRSVSKSGSGYVAAGWQDRDSGTQDVAWLVSMSTDGNPSLSGGYGTNSNTEDSEGSGVTCDASGNFLLAGLYYNGVTNFSMLKITLEELSCAHNQTIGSVTSLTAPVLSDQTGSGYETVTKSALLTPTSIEDDSLITRTCSTPLVILPVTLIDFEGQSNNTTNKLFWKTASERNNDRFTLYRSEDGDNWEKVTFINGAGNSSDTLYYEVYDNTPYSPITYYRLQQTDFNGESTQSEIILVTRHLQEKLAELYPNPTDGKVNIHIKEKSEFKLQIFSIDSNLIEQFYFNDNQNLITIDLSSYASGLYYVKLIQDDKIQTTKIIIR